MNKEHILVLGASGGTGFEVIRYHKGLAPHEKPYLTLYIRPGARSKLATVLNLHDDNYLAQFRTRIVEGHLTDKAAIQRALSVEHDFPPVTAVLSVLGAYMSFGNFISRNKSTPIADALRSTIIPTMKEAGVKRILVLSTPSGFPLPEEPKNMSWGWWAYTLVPEIMVPQGSAEMAAIGKVTAAAGGLDYTIFRVPYLSGEAGDLKIMAGEIGKNGFTENKSLSRASLAKWIFEEIEQKNWIQGAPMLCNI